MSQKDIVVKYSFVRTRDCKKDQSEVENRFPRDRAENCGSPGELYFCHVCAVAKLKNDQ